MADMLESYLGFDTYFLILGIMGGMLLLVIFLLIMTINTRKKLKKLIRNYTDFMRGKDAESMEEAILKKFAEVDNLEEKDRQKQQKIEDL